MLTFWGLFFYSNESIVSASIPLKAVRGLIKALKSKIQGLEETVLVMTDIGGKIIFRLGSVDIQTEPVKLVFPDYKAIVGSQFAWFLNAQDNEKFFCSEFCLNAIDYALQFTLTYRGQTLEKKGYHKFNPTRLFKYLKNMELIGRKVM